MLRRHWLEKRNQTMCSASKGATSRSPAVQQSVLIYNGIAFIDERFANIDVPINPLVGSDSSR